MVYIIGDLHLANGNPEKSMEVFGPSWENYMEKIHTNWLNTVTEDDSVIIAGDFSWAMTLEEALDDFKYLDSLPGEKYMLKGNHDYWWSTVSKMEKFLDENNISNTHFIYNNSYIIKDVALVGTKGWSTLNPEEEYTNIRREYLRLNNSILDMEKKLGSLDEEKKKDLRKVCVLHYPPIYRDDVIKRYKEYLENSDYTEEEKKIMLKETDFLGLLKEHDITTCYYGHLHGASHNDAIEGLYDGIHFKLISGDYVDFNLTKV